ncbi:MAG: EVE domain-containing protein [Rhizobiaceae bacterium]|nr:EVE domain-containing protein [Rhizobiaceae bacterium]
MTRYWVGVVSREHVKTGEAGGFCQLCHGKDAPVRRMCPGDWLIYYSPREKMRGGEPVQAFTAIGQIKPGVPYTHSMGNDFTPTRRDVNYHPAVEAPIRPMLDDLSFTKNQKSWGMILRRGIFEIPADDFQIISTEMGLLLT